MATIENAARQFWQVAHAYNILAFSGDMGAGKTTFIHALCTYLQVQDAVSSPTFALINEYHFNDNGRDRVMYHMDWYRLRSTEEAVDSGMEDCLLQKDNYSLIEWPEKAPEIIPHPHLWITIKTHGENERMMDVWLKN